MIKALLASILIFITFNLCEAAIALKADEKGKFYAKLENVSLAEVTDFFKDNYGIEFIGDDTLFQTQVSISFNNLSIEKALKRIFSKSNFALTYNSKGEITEVNLLLYNKNKTKSAAASSFSNNKDQTLTVEQAPDPFQDSNLVQDELPILDQEDPGVQTTDEITSFQVEPNSPPPGDSFQVDPNAPLHDEAFRVIVNSPPPGDSFEIVPSAPPSGE